MRDRDAMLTPHTGRYPVGMAMDDIIMVNNEPMCYLKRQGACLMR